MKSVLITSNAYFPNIGGIENSLRYLAREYLKKGYEVNVVVSDVNNVTDDKLPPFEILDGINIYRYSTQHSVHKLLRPLSGFLTLISLLKLLKKVKLEKNPDFTISRFHTTTWLAKIARLENVIYLLPGVVKYQNHPSRTSQKKGIAKVKQLLRYYYHVWLQSNAFRSADRLAVFSSNMADQVSSCAKPSKPLLLVKPGVDNERFCPCEHDQIQLLRDKYKIPRSETVLLCIGRFVKAKGFMYVLESLRKLSDVHLVLVGGGEEEDEYRRYIISQRLENRVTFTGVLQDPKECYQLSDIFLMSSIYEPFGQTIIEVLSSGLPVVAFKPSEFVITATEELLSDAEAVFVEEVNSESLSEAVKTLISDPNNMARLSNLSRKIAIEKFSWEVLAHKLECYQ